MIHCHYAILANLEKMSMLIACVVVEMVAWLKLKVEGARIVVAKLAYVVVVKVEYFVSVKMYVL